MGRRQNVLMALAMVGAVSSGLSQIEEIHMGRAAANWESGEYTNYAVNKNLVMKFKTVKLDFDKGRDGEVTAIRTSSIVGDFKLTKYNGGPDLCYKGRYGSYMHVTDKSIVVYKIENGEVLVTAMYGEKYGGGKKAVSDIQAYRDGIKDFYAQQEAERKAAELAHKKKYSIQGRDVEKIEIELISKDSKIDCDSEFKIGYKVTMADGQVIKSHSLGGQAYPTDYKVKVVGADGLGLKNDKGDKLSYKLYTVSKYCDYMQDKQVVVSVTSKADDNDRAEIKLPTSCVPDPEVIAQKQREAEREKERKLLAAKRAEQEKEKERLLAEQQKKAAARAKTLAATMSNGKVVGNGDGIGLLIFDTNVKGINTNPEKVKSHSFKTINGKILGFGTTGRGAAINTYSKGKITSKKVTMKEGSGGHMIDGDLDKSGNVFYIQRNKLVFAQNAGATFTEKESISSEDLFGKDKIELHAIASIGENKCIAFAYTITKMDGYIEGRRYDRNNRSTQLDKLYMAIWDRVTGKKMVREVLEYHSYCKPKVMKTYDGKVVLAYQDLGRYLWKLDALATFKSGEIKTIWKKELPDPYDRQVGSSSGYALQPIHMFEDKDKNIVITFQDQWKVMSYMKEAGDYNHVDNRYCGFTGIGRIDKTGSLYQENFFTGYNLSRWGGSHEYSLKNVSYPGQMLMHANNHPVATQHPITGDYIMVNTGEGAQVEYPMDFTKIPRKDYSGDEMVALGHCTEPNVVIVSGLDMNIQSFDLVETTFKLADGKKVWPSTNYFRNPGMVMVDYDNTTKEIILYHDDARFSYRIKPSFLLQWAGAEDQDITQSSANKLDQEVASTSSSKNNSSRNNSRSNSSSNSPKGDKEEDKGPKMVQVQVNPNGKGESNVKVWWKVDGQWKKSTMNNRTTSVIGKVAAGTQLYYTVDREDHRHVKPFYVVPGDKGSSVSNVKIP